jgi:CHAT domain-containing protein
MQVMGHFYQGLKAGDGVAMALAQAKLNYLKENPGQFAHPFYWAGFILNGDDGVIDLK